MSELPESKVLRGILTKLKAKTTMSWSSLAKTVTDYGGLFNQWVKIIEQRSEENDASRQSYEIVKTLQRYYFELIVETMEHIGNLNIYIESLESYFTEKDKAFKDSLEKGKKDAEEIKQQLEELKKKSTDYIR